MKKLLSLLLLISFISNAQTTKIKYKQMENPATSSVNLGTQFLAVGSVSVATTETITSTLKLGSAVLTGGNTGTVAVLSDAVFGVNCGGINASPADATTYYFGNGVMGSSTWLTTQGWSKIYLPYNCTLVGYTANFFNATSAASAETSTLSINIDNTPTVLSSAITMSAAINTFTATGLNINVNAGSYIDWVVFG